MVDTGWVLAGTATSSGSDVAWNSETNVTASDNTYAFTDDMAADQFSDSLIASGFDFSAIAPADTITGIQVKIEHKRSGSGAAEITDDQVKVGISGLYSTNYGKSSDWATSDEEITYPNTSTVNALWGHTPTYSDLGNLQVKLVAVRGDSGGNAIGYVDAIWMKIHYTVGPISKSLVKADLVLDAKTPTLDEKHFKTLVQGNATLDGKALEGGETHLKTLVQAADLALDGKTAALTSGQLLVLEPGDLGLTGKKVTIFHELFRIPPQGDLTLDGKTPTLRYDHLKTLVQANLFLDGKTAAKDAANSLELVKAELSLSPKAMTMSVALFYTLVQGDLVLDGKALDPPQISKALNLVQANLALDGKVIASDEQHIKTMVQGDLTLDPKTTNAFVIDVSKSKSAIIEASSPNVPSGSLRGSVTLSGKTT